MARLERLVPSRLGHLIDLRRIFPTMADTDAPAGIDEAQPLRNRPWRRRVNRYAAGLTHLVFVSLLLLTAMKADFSQNESGGTPIMAESVQEEQREETASLKTEAQGQQPSVSEPKEQHAGKKAGEPPQAEASRPPQDARIARLLAAYPDFLSGYENNELIWRDGSRMPFDDGRAKDFRQRLEEPDVEDMFAQPYPARSINEPPGVNIDPGRVRHDGFFTRLYGDCRKGEVERHLVDVIWLPSHGNKKIKFTSLNGAAEKLQLVSNELDALPAKFIKYLQPISGTFNCRNIARTSRLSAHSYGIAIDLNAKYGHYWQWNRPSRDGLYAHRNDVPWEIASVFEKHGFIWGAKWYHFDSFHFEFRPELLPDSHH